MRLLTWNVNGLRAALRRGDMSLAAFLASLNAGTAINQVYEPALAPT